MRTLSSLITGGLVLLLLGGCDDFDIAKAFAGSDPAARRGKVLIVESGCGTCHMVPGVAQADGLVGPPLLAFSRRTYLAGLLRNTPDNLVTWLRWPQQVVPGNAMPDMGLTDREARDIAAYLYTIR